MTCRFQRFFAGLLNFCCLVPSHRLKKGEGAQTSCANTTAIGFSRNLCYGLISSVRIVIRLRLTIDLAIFRGIHERNTFNGNLMLSST